MTHTTETTPNAEKIAAGLLELAERCEAATGPDRELDFAILCLVDPRAAKTGPLPGDPEFTASLDAAMTLVLEGYVVGSLKQRTRYEIVEAKNNSVDLSEQAAWSAWVHKDTNDRTFRVGLRFSHHGAAATPALALCAAALRAREILRREA